MKDKLREIFVLFGKLDVNEEEQDELDRYRNYTIEQLRSAIEELALKIKISQEKMEETNIIVKVGE